MINHSSAFNCTNGTIMLYKEFLKRHKKCPFCKTKDRIIKQNKYAFLTYARAPYSHFHLLACPKRHITSLLKLKKNEEMDIDSLIQYGSQLVKKAGAKSYTILIREGGTHKSIPHIHYHIIPNHRIGDFDIRGKKRRILTEKEIKNLMKRFIPSKFKTN